MTSYCKDFDRLHNRVCTQYFYPILRKSSASYNANVWLYNLVYDINSSLKNNLNSI